MLTGILLLYICKVLALPTWCLVVSWVIIVLNTANLFAEIYKLGQNNK